MKNQGPIVIIEDDHEDQDIFYNIFREIEVPNNILICENGVEALELLRTLKEQPLLIICDVNMPKMNGLDLLKEIHADPELKNKSIPFVFFSTAARESEVKIAYQMTVQGYFIKDAAMDDLRRTLKLLYDYWTTCIHPLNVS